MAQIRECEVCSDPLPIDNIGTICDNCQREIESFVGDESDSTDSTELEKECDENIASVEASSSSATPNETTLSPSAGVSTSENSGASSAGAATGFGDLLSLDLLIPRKSEVQEIEIVPPAEPKLPESMTGALDAASESVPAKSENECEACGYIQKELHLHKSPFAKEPMKLCDKCFAAEVALTKPQDDDPMQGKIIHPDEAERQEILSMDEEDRIIYNDECLINATIPLEQVQARIDLLERRLHRALIQHRAARRTKLMRIETLDKKEREERYRQDAERYAKRKRRAQGDATEKKVKTSSTRAPRQSKAQKFREAMLANGFSAEWIEEQVKKMGLE